MEHIKTRLRKLRIEKNLSQENLADDLNVDQSLISRFENGERVPNNEQISIIADSMDVSIEELTKDTEMTIIAKPQKRSKLNICINPECPGLSEIENIVEFLTKRSRNGITKIESHNESSIRLYKTVPGELDEKYCGYCGSHLYNSCKLCGELIQHPNKPFCGNCGMLFFHICDHPNPDMGHLMPSPIEVYDNRIGDEEIYDSFDPSLAAWEPTGDLYQTQLLRRVVDISNLGFIEQPIFKIPDVGCEREGFAEYKSAKFKEGNSFQTMLDFIDESFTVRIINIDNEMIYERYISRYQGICSICGCWDFEFASDGEYLASVEGFGSGWAVDGPKDFKKVLAKLNRYYGKSIDKQQNQRNEP